MDPKLESASWSTADKTAFLAKCQSVDEAFHKYGLLRCELNFPQTGLCESTSYPLAHVKHRDIHGETIVRPMKFVIYHDPKLGLRRYIEQQLTRPMMLKKGQADGFLYEVSPKSDVRVSRLIVDLKDLEHAIDLLIAEANRFYLLYCYPY